MAVPETVIVLFSINVLPSSGVLIVMTGRRGELSSRIVIEPVSVELFWALSFAITVKVTVLSDPRELNAGMARRCSYELSKGRALPLNVRLSSSTFSVTEIRTFTLSSS